MCVVVHDKQVVAQGDGTGPARLTWLSSVDSIFFRNWSSWEPTPSPFSASSSSMRICAIPSAARLVRGTMIMGCCLQTVLQALLSWLMSGARNSLDRCACMALVSDMPLSLCTPAVMWLPQKTPFPMSERKISIPCMCM